MSLKSQPLTGLKFFIRKGDQICPVKRAGLVPGCFDWDLSKQAHITYSLTGKLVVMATLANCPARDKLAFHKRRLALCSTFP